MNHEEYLFLADHGECAKVNEDFQTFFPEGKLAVVSEKTAQAKKLCSNCAVKNECLLIAIKGNEYGIWGGMTERERQNFKRTWSYRKILQSKVRKP